MPTIIDNEDNIVVINDPRVSIVTVGIQGPPGIDGVTAASYVHTQATPSTTWTINHNLGFRPAVELYTVGGVEFDAEVVHVSNNQAIVYLVSSIAGSARCN